MKIISKLPIIQGMFKKFMDGLLKFLFDVTLIFWILETQNTAYNMSTAEIRRQKLPF